MGWMFTRGASKQTVIDKLIKAWDSEKLGHVKTVGHAVVSGGEYAHLWAVVEAEKMPQRVIALYLLDHDQFGWGYKDMDETMGVYYYTCPLELIELAGPTDNQTAKEWRRKNAAKQGFSQRELFVDPPAQESFAGL